MKMFCERNGKMSTLAGEAGMDHESFLIEFQCRVVFP